MEIQKSDANTTISELKDRIMNFCERRGWADDKNVKNVTMALSVEVSELMEIFQWTHSDKANDIVKDPKGYEHVKEEIADVFWYLMRICDALDVDLTQAMLDKERKNAIKYPE